MKIKRSKNTSANLSGNTLDKKTFYLFISLLIVVGASSFTKAIASSEFAPLALRSGLINTIVAVITSVVTYLIAAKWLGNFKDSYKSVSDYLHIVNVGLLIGLLVPLNASVYMVVMSTVVAIYVSNLVYGGRGYGIFNTAVVAALFMTLSFNITPLEIASKRGIVSLVAPLQELKIWLEGGDFTYHIRNVLNGYTIGISFGNSVGFTLIVLFVILAFKKVIDYRLSLSFFISAAAMLYIVSLVAGYSYLFVLAHLISGYMLLATVFLVTDESTTPATRESKILFGFFTALFTVSMRLLSMHTEGILFAILLSNMISPTLNRTLTRSNNKLLIKTLVLVGVLVIGFGYFIGSIASSRFIVSGGLY